MIPLSSNTVYIDIALMRESSAASFRLPAMRKRGKQPRLKIHSVTLEREE
jgi:hypothetical protein